MQSLSRFAGPKAFTYDVFISFRGPDTRNGFTSHLYRSLHERGFRTFKDNPELQEGDKLTKGLFNGIEESRVFVIVLSETYASSPFCLKELVKILDEFAKGGGRRVLTVFYHSNPAEVVDQTGCYGRELDALQNFVTPESFKEWKEALRKVGSPDFSTWHLQVDKANDKPEHKYVDEIVREVSKHVPYPIGLDHHVHKVMSYLSSKFDGSVVGICGNPGIGKTTIARSVFSLFCYNNAVNSFDNYFFIDKVIEQTLLHLRKFNQKKVFIVFEDVDDPKHLEAIVELIKNWFGSGSKAIITAQDKCLLEYYGIKNIYGVEKFSAKDDDNYKLLGVKVFNSDKFPVEYLSIFYRAKNYASGNPFILEVIGSYLSGKSVEECMTAMKQYESIPKENTKMILQMSFDALEKAHQNMLIDIALDFKESDLAEVEEKLRMKNNGVCPKRDIRVLLETSLIKIDEYGWVILHALTQDMVKDNVPLPRLDPGAQSKAQLYEEYGKLDPNLQPDVIEVRDSPKQLYHQSSYE